MRARTSRRQETLFIPFIAPADDAEHSYVVKVREGDGAFYIVTDPMPRRSAARRMRQMREDMFKAWLAQRG